MKKSRGGFTLIEMALSLVFIGILSVMMVLMIQNTTASYRRGLILNQLNTVGMDLIDDIRTSIQGANTDALDKLCERKYGIGDNECTRDNGNSFVSVTKYAPVKVDGKYLSNNNRTDSTIPVYGAFCTGTYTYIWNSGYFEEGDYAGQRVVEGATKATLEIGGIEKTDFRLLKVYDRERTVCVNANKLSTSYKRIPAFGAANFDSYNNDIRGNFKVDNSGTNADPNSENVVELLKVNAASDLVIYDLYMTKPATSKTRKNLFFAGSFILGTRKGGMNSIKVSGSSCKPPSDETGYSNLEYCAINKFNFAVQAGGN